MANKLTGSIVSYPDRGQWGNNKYRGNCTGHLIADLLETYKPRQFVEIFAGGGTGLEVCQSMGITNSLHLDLNPKFGGWNALKDEIPNGGDLYFSHPAYHDMIVYSGEMWGEAHPDDLSRCASYDEFINKLNLVNIKIYNSMRNGGRHAMLIGDMRRKGAYYCMIKDLAWYGDMESMVIKAQHNTVSGRKQYANRNFIGIEHEYMLVFRKNEIWAVPVKVTKTEQRNLLNSKTITWRDLVQSALEHLGGKAKLNDIYEVIEGADKVKNNEHWQAKIRQTLQMGAEFFASERGIWNLQFRPAMQTA